MNGSSPRMSRGSRPDGSRPRVSRRYSPRQPGAWLRALVGAAGLLTLAACGASHSGSAASAGQVSPAMARAAAQNPDLDTGSSLQGAAAPNFRLTNQFGQPVSLSDFRGKVVILAFTDSECTTICPLTTASMVEARELLGHAGDQVQLLGVDANPEATSRADVMSYSRSHAMVNQWGFLTGSPAQLRAVWKAYHVYVQIEKGDIDHTPALYVIDQRGRERELYLTTMAYTTVTQAAQILAQEAASLLPSHPKLASVRSLAFVGGTSPATAVTVPAASPGRTAPVTLGPGKARLVVFFATWLDEVSPLRARLLALNAYARAERAGRLPALTAIDEAVTEPSSGTARTYLTHLGGSLSYPVGLDTTGRLADGYGVQDQPWLVLVSARGKVVWSHDGWLPTAALEAAARAHG
jgi:cytochrome oxidase Cu insertion factor (SCO1/SenC/PrrC family)